MASPARHQQGRLCSAFERPTTGEQIVVSWVNNTAGPGGDGTVEHPYNVLPSSVDSDYVLVQRVWVTLSVISC